VKKRRRFRRNW